MREKFLPVYIIIILMYFLFHIIWCLHDVLYTIRFKCTATRKERGRSRRVREEE